MNDDRRPVLVVFDTRYGQSGEIAKRVERRLRARGHAVDIEQTPGARPLTLCDYAGVVVIAPVYNRRHSEAIERFVHTYAASLCHLPTAFISVSIAAAARLRFVRAGVRRVSERLFAASHWHPPRVLYAGGSIEYPIYAPAMQRWMRTAAFVFGLPRDTTRRHELTRWEDVLSLVDAFLSDVASDAESHAIPAMA